MVLNIEHGIYMTPLINNLKEENEHLHHLVAKLGDLLTATVNVLKGPPQENTMHSTHDIVEVARQLKDRVEALEASLEAEQEAGRQLREEYGTGLREAAESQREACKLTAISYAKTQELISKEKLEDAPGSATMHAIESMMAERVAVAIDKTPLVTDTPVGIYKEFVPLQVTKLFDEKPLPACKNCGRVMLVGKCCGKPEY